MVESQIVQAPSEWLARTRLLLGDEKLAKLQKSHVLVVGLGGVGAYAAEMICRAGVGKMTIVDGDIVQPSNRNRQLIALKSTEGAEKAGLLSLRLLDINPDLNLVTLSQYLKDEKLLDVLLQPYDYVVDAIDTLSPKLHLIANSLKNNLKLISSMGAGGKLDPLQVRVADVSESYNCRLAFYIRKRLHRMGYRTGFKVVFSPEPVDKETVAIVEQERNKKSVAGTISYMPPIFGCHCASVVIRDLMEN